MCPRWFILLALAACAVRGDSITERARAAVHRRHEERGSLIPLIRNAPPHNFYGPPFFPPETYSKPASNHGAYQSNRNNRFPPLRVNSSSQAQRPQQAGGRPVSAGHGTAGAISEEQRQLVREARKVISAGNKFGLNLMQYLAADNDNTIMAPVSLSIALGMVYFAADGNTKKELAHALHYDEYGLNSETIMAPLRGVSAAGRATNEKGFSLELGNFLFAQKGLNVSERYRNVIKDVFDSTVETVDFSKPEQARNHMNQLITKATRGQIASPVESIGPDTRMVLMNAVYFKGFWKQPFSIRSSFDATFANDGVNEVAVKMMYMRNSFLVKSLPDIGADAIQLPYEGDMTVMLVLLPKNPTGINEMVQKLDVVKLIEGLPTYVNESLDLHMPRFSVRGSYRFKQHLYNLGVRDVFTPGAANLPEVDPAGGVVLSDVIHEAKIQVDERGTEAVALTTTPIINYSRYPSFNIRHPFVFFIVHKSTGAIFFAGKILRMNEGEAPAPPVSAPAATGSRYLGVGRRN